MKLKKMVTGIVISLVVIAVLLAVTDRPSKAEDQAAGSGNQDVLAKLDEVLKSQQDVMKRLDEIREEMGIVKVRVTQLS